MAGRGLDRSKGRQDLAGGAVTITAEQKREHREAKAQAAAAVARLNALYEATGCAYRVRVATFLPFALPDLVGDPIAPDDPPANDLDELAPIDGYRGSYRPDNDRVGSKRTEREDETEGEQ
jgi:hypothetical protein